MAVWLFDLGFNGGKFHPLQLIGFAFMFTGTAVSRTRLDPATPGVQLPLPCSISAGRPLRDADHHGVTLNRRPPPQVYNEALRLPCLSYPTAEERSEAARARGQALQRRAPLLGDESWSATPAGTPTEPSLVVLALGNASPQQLRVGEFFTPTLSRFTLQKS